MALIVVKASGQSEEFHIQKLVNSLIRSGASGEAAWDIARKVERQQGETLTEAGTQKLELLDDEQ